MKIRSTLFAALLLSAAPAFAQTPPAATAPAPVAATPAMEMTKDGKPQMKAVRMQCRDTVKAGNLKGEPARQAMQDCIVKQRPDMEARVKCQMDPSLKSMDKAAKHLAIKACITKTKV